MFLHSFVSIFWHIIHFLSSGLSSNLRSFENWWTFSQLLRRKFLFGLIWLYLDSYNWLVLVVESGVGVCFVRRGWLLLEIWLSFLDDCFMPSLYSFLVVFFYLDIWFSSTFLWIVDILTFCLCYNSMRFPFPIAFLWDM